MFNIFIHPCILLAEFCGGRQNHSTCEYYQPNMMDRQLGCGQVPPRLFLHEFLKPREEIKESLQAKIHPLFISWWPEFHDHIFSELVHFFCLELMPDFQPTSEVMHLSFPFIKHASSTDHDFVTS
jgi:hypothetical protein